ncbi:hypothetical protein [Methylobacterium sp.]|uniref:hypothetical protein n=1 Tax=Methylobacterium sp. TaxID=409 RepID=UPI002615729F|nr:hypothetical protein [Methylobacterium sp.]
MPPAASTSCYSLCRIPESKDFGGGPKMARWIPSLAVVGVVSLMAVPGPGLWGLLIALACSFGIVVSAILWLLDRMVTRLALGWDRNSTRRPRRRVRPGSGVIQEAGTQPKPAPAAGPAIPSPIQERARLAALRREARRLEPLRLR